MPFLVFCFFICATPVMPALARSTDYQVIPLMLATNAGWGTQVFATGHAAALGGGDPLRAVKLRWSEGNVWTGRVALRKGDDTRFTYVLRNGSAERFCDPGNIVAAGGEVRSAGAMWTAKRPGKIVYYYSGWTGATLVVQRDGERVAYPMAVAGAGRKPGEWLYRVARVEAVGTEVSFAFEGSVGDAPGRDVPPASTGEDFYRTTLDNFVVQDGGVYSYWPEAMVSEPVVVTHSITSSVEGIPGRGIRLYLPRGYNEHHLRRYPVVYFQDGTNVFSPGGPFGSWDADIVATREVAMGRMRESILVAIDNTPARRQEYNPDGDRYPGGEGGMASRYLDFIVRDVIPFVNGHYRTRTGAADQVAAGSSMGGIFSVYAGFATNRFGAVLAMSPSFTRAPAFTGRLSDGPKPALRIYLDTGNGEGMIGPQPGGDYWDSVWWGYDQLLKAGFVPGGDLRMRIGCGHGHHEAAWRSRLAEAFCFLLDPADEPLMEERVTFSEESPTH